MNDFLRTLLFLPPQASTVARRIDQLHFVVITATMLGALLVTVIGGWFVLRYRRPTSDTTLANADATARPHVAFKIGSTVGLTVLFLVFWAIGLRTFMRLRVAPPGAMIIYVTAKKWMWTFAYPAGARSIERLFVPVGRPVELYMTSRDVIHGFYVPAFRVKNDVVPGRTMTLWFEARTPGTYPILCTQYCGTGHSMMRGEVVALSPEDFDRWLDGWEPGETPAVAGPVYVEPQLGLVEPEPGRPVSMVRQGERVAAETGCLRCHTLDGSPHIGPTWAGLYGSVVPLEGGSEVVADVAYITESIMDPMAKIHRGFQAVMPSYLGRLGPGEVSAIVELIRSLRDVEAQPGARTPLGAQPPGPPLERDDLQGRGARERLPEPEPPGGEIKK
jgi:cytochrome c oxidase subunit 2